MNPLTRKYEIFVKMKKETTEIASEILVVRQILLVNQFDHHQDFLYAKKRNPVYD